MHGRPEGRGARPPAPAPRRRNADSAATNTSRRAEVRRNTESHRPPPAVLQAPSAPARWRAATGASRGEPRGRHQSDRSEEHTSELQSLMRISYAVFCLKKKKQHTYTQKYTTLNKQ